MLHVGEQNLLKLLTGSPIKASSFIGVQKAKPSILDDPNPGLQEE